MSDTSTQQPCATLVRRETESRIADQIVDILIKAGVNVVFGVPGGAIAAIHDALLDRPEVRVVSNRTEAGAMFAAAAYARTSGTVGVVLVTSGPGALNCMTGLASAMCDGLPVLVIAGEVPRKVRGKGALQDGNALNVVGMAKNVTKMAREIQSPASAIAVLRRTLNTMLSGRPGPAFLSLPLDVSLERHQRCGIAANVQVSITPDSALLAKVANTLLQAKRPLLLAGSGARWGNGPQRLHELAERLQIPVATTPKGKGVFPESHSLSLGVCGHGGHASVTDYLKHGIDVLLAVGTGLSDPATNGWSPLLEPMQHMIQIDVDALQIGRHYPVSVGIVARADQCLEGILDSLQSVLRPSRGFGIQRYTDPATVTNGPEGRITPQRALWELQRWLPSNTLFVCDIGVHMLLATHYLHIDDPRGFGIMTGLASMGSGIAAAIGTKLAAPAQPVCAIVGDGCFGVAMPDLATAAHDAVPIIVAVLNDGRYGMVELGNEALYGRTPDYRVNELSIPEIAASLGIGSVVIREAGELENLAPGWPSGPVVLDLRIDRQVQMPKQERFEDLRRAASIPRPSHQNGSMEVA